MNKARILMLGSVFVGLVGFGAVAHAQQPQTVPGMTQSDQSVFDILGSDPRFRTTMQMVYGAGASSRMATRNNLVVFAATNDAWGDSGFGGLLSSLSSTGAGSEFPQPMAILDVVRGFVVRGEPAKLDSPDLQLRSVAGRAIDFNTATQTVKWIDTAGRSHLAHVAGTPIAASNGLVVPVDKVVGG